MDIKRSPHSFSIGLPQMHLEAGERRAFLPQFVTSLQNLGLRVVLEYGYGSTMSFAESEYQPIDGNGVQFSSEEEAYAQDIVLVLRYPSVDRLDMMRSGACLISMIHYPTRPDRVADLRQRGLEAISLDSVVDDSGRRVVENLRAVAWNGTETAFNLLKETCPAPGLGSPERSPIRAMLIGAGAVGSHAVQAAIRYGDRALWERLARQGVPGVQVTVVDYDLTSNEAFMLEHLQHTDLLIDATQRPDPSHAVIPNRWIGEMPGHAVLLDLAVDPYHCEREPRMVKGIEGIPHGNLDQYTFMPDDPSWGATVPDCVDSAHRRAAAACYSWPGLHPRECMQVYGQQIHSLLRNLTRVGGLESIRMDGRFFQRAMARALLSNWHPNQ
jgi:alanine dehydrogenase